MADQARHPSIAHLLKYFTYGHLPEQLAKVSKPFCVTAHELTNTLPESPELTACLRKLLEAKDCAVRAALT